MSSSSPSHEAVPVAALDAGERAQELHLAVALGARDAEDLALLDLEVDRAEAVAPEARDLEEHLGRRVRSPSRSGKASWSGRPIMSATSVSSDIAGGLERPLPDAVAEDA